MGAHCDCQAPNSSYSDNSHGITDEGCTEGIEYEYIGSVKDTVVSWESHRRTVTKVKKMFIISSLRKQMVKTCNLLTLLYDKVKKYEADAQKFGWQKICFATRLFLLNKGFTWYEIGILDCCQKPF